VLWVLNYGYSKDAKSYMRLSKDEEEEDDRGVFD
jgi:hypothetical protein